jgi:tetratricopeptide (TPR) repeat protein
VISQVPATGPSGGPAGGGPDGPVRCGLVPPLADSFSSRPETAAALAAALVPGAAVALVPARPPTGSPDWLGTCGKTQLAGYAAESLWHARELSLLLWVTATSRATVLAGYEQAAAAVGVGAAGDADAAAARFLAWLAETGQPWLVVLDDVAAPAGLAELWPEGPAGRVLITAASQAVIPAGRPVATIGVGAFSQREALSYLMGRLTADTDQRLGAIDLVADLGGEPLALAQASGVIATSAMSCRDYRGYFVDRRAQLVKQLRERPGSRPPAPAVTWMFAVEQADRLAPGAGVQPALALAALLDRHGIPATVFGTPAATAYLTAAGAGTAPGDQDRARDALLTMERTALLEIDQSGSPTLIRMTSAVQAAVRAAMPARLQEQAARAAADALLQAWADGEQPPLLAESLRCCTASLHEVAGNLLWSGGCHPVLLRAGQSLAAARLNGPAVAYWHDLVSIAERKLGGGHPDTLALAERLAAAYLAAGQMAAAVTCFERVAADRARLFGPDHPGAVAARRDLGRTLLRAGQYGPAITVLGGVLSEYERICGPRHPDTLGSRDDLAAGYRAAGRISDAIPLYRQTLADRERDQGQQHPDTLTTRQHLADTYLANGQVKEAISNYKRVLADRERVLGREHTDTIAARGNLAAAYHAAGRMASAVRLYEETRAGYERALGSDHPSTLARSLSLAGSYYAVGRLTDARTLLEETLAGCERVLPPGDPLTQSARDSLANIAGDPAER